MKARGFLYLILIAFVLLIVFRIAPTAMKEDRAGLVPPIAIVGVIFLASQKRIA